VSEVYEAVLERPVTERVGFLATVCAGDEDLLEEVRSLLAQDDRESPLDRPVWVSGDLLAESQAGPTVGSRLGPYQVEALIGSGGMGAVYRGMDTRLDRAVAIKVLRPEVSGDAAFRSRFDREARTISQLDHPNICTLYDVGDDGATAYLVMQHLEGESLLERVGRGALPVDEVIRIGSALASALAYAHDRGILHRDIKPQNVIVLPDGRVKLVDFGIAKPHSVGQAATSAQTSEALTLMGQTLGTLEYMSPEQLSGHDVDGRSDMFSLGLLLHQLATGRHPFRGETPMLTASAVLLEEYQGLPDASGPTRDLERVLTRMLAKAPADRYPTMGECLADLRLLEQRTARMEVPSTDHGTVARRRWLIGAGVVLGAVVLFVLMRGASAPPVDEAGSSSTTEASPPVIAPTTVSYWLEVEPPAERRADVPGFRSVGNDVFESGWRFRVNLQADVPGYVYLLADEPATAAQTGLALLFTTGTTGQATDGGAPATTDWFVFTGPPAREHMWLVWSAVPVEELASLASLLNPRERGVVADPETARRVRAFLDSDAARDTAYEVDRNALRAMLSSSRPLLVHRLELQHD